MPKKGYDEGCESPELRVRPTASWTLTRRYGLVPDRGTCLLVSRDWSPTKVYMPKKGVDEGSEPPELHVRPAARACSRGPLVGCRPQRRRAPWMRLFSRRCENRSSEKSPATPPAGTPTAPPRRPSGMLVDV
eukprot:5074511-Pyramimonas_sp.AAC.3